MCENIPEQFETERLLIRMPLPGDGAELNAAVLESFDALKQWMPWAQTRPTVAESAEYSQKMHEAFGARKDFGLRVFLKGTGTLVGSSGHARVQRPEMARRRLAALPDRVLQRSRQARRHGVRESRRRPRRSRYPQWQTHAQVVNSYFPVRQTAPAVASS
jgi:hypothetical protein